MATVVESGHGFIRLILDNADFNYASTVFTTGQHMGMQIADVYPAGLALTGIKFEPSAVNDTLVVRLNSLTGPLLSTFTAISGDALKDMYTGNKLYKPYIKYSELTLDTDTSATIWFEFDNVPHT